MNFGDQRDLGSEMRSILLAQVFPPPCLFLEFKKFPQTCLLQTSLLFSDQPPVSHGAGELWQANMQTAELETINIFYW